MVEPMSKQITVRLPNEQVAFLDEEVRAGAAPSRAALVSQAIDRFERERRAAREVLDMAARGGDPYPDLAGVPAAVSRKTLDYDG